MEQGDVAHPPSMLTEEEFDKGVEASNQSGLPLLLQLGSEKCERCPAFHAAIAELKSAYNFTWTYCDAHNPDTDLPERFSITRLPAFVLHHTGSAEPLVVANASPEQLQAAVSKKCTPILTLDADF